MRLFLLTFVLLLFLAAPARAMQPIVLDNQAIVDFPNTITFRLELAEENAVSEAILHYDVRQRECADVSSRVPVEVEGNVIEWTWVMSRSGNPPPGSQVWWEWTLVNEQGNSTTLPRQSLTLEDDRFEWQTVTEGPIHLYWYEGEQTGPLLLEAATAGLDRLQNDMGIELQDDVHLYIYETAQQMREAVLYVQDWAGGVAFSEYNTILIGVPPNLVEGWGQETVRHELAHLVTGQFGWSCLGGSRPTWLEEGLATYAEGPADAETTADITLGIQNNRFEPLRSLSGAFPSHSQDAGLAYSQSYSVVAFLLDGYGEEQMQRLIRELAAGSGYDAALQEVYGFNMDGLEILWREEIGAPPRSIPPTPTPVQAALVPTVPPLSAPQSRPTPTGLAQTPPENSAPGASGGICGLSALPLLLLGWVAVRRRP